MSNNVAVDRTTKKTTVFNDWFSQFFMNKIKKNKIKKEKSGIPEFYFHLCSMFTTFRGNQHKLVMQLSPENYKRI